MTSLEWAALLGATAFAATAQGAIGFGFAMLVVPAYLLALDSLAAVQLSIVTSLVNTAILAPRLWGALPKPLMARLMAGALLGLPLGLFVFRAMDVEVAKLMVGAVLLVSALHGLIRRWRGRNGSSAEPATHPWLDVAVGIVTGAMTVSLSMPGAVLVVYLVLAGVPKDAMRATTLTMFLCSYALALPIQAFGAGMAITTWQMAAMTTPLAAAGALLGHHLAGRLSPVTHRRAAFALMILTGVLAAVTTLS